MSLSTITTNRTDGNLNRQLPGEDHISALIVYGAKPAQFGSANTVLIYSLKEAETAGITAGALPVLNYHVAEFFDKNPRGLLYVMIKPVPAGAHTFEEVKEVQLFANNRLRLVGVHTEAALSTAMVTTLQSIIQGLRDDHAPLLAILSADIVGQTLGGLPALRGLGADGVAVTIGQDGGNTGAALFGARNKSINNVGCMLGELSKTPVHESLAWVSAHNIATVEHDVLAFGNGVLFNTQALGQLNDLSTKGYNFLQKRIIPGSYFSSTWTASNGDYDTIENVRTIDKAVRAVEAALEPYLNAPIYTDPSTGFLSVAAIAGIRAAANRPLRNLQGPGNISGFRAFVNPEQDVQSTRTLTVGIEIVGVAVARNIIVNIGYAVKTN